MSWRGAASMAAQVLLTLLVLEGVSRVALSRPGLYRALGATAGHGRWIAAHEAGLAPERDEGVTLGVPWDHDPELGWVMRPGWTSQTPPRVTVDRAGLRAGPDRAPGPGDRPAVVVVGDSFGFGADVDDDQTFVAHAAARLPDVELLNLSVVGYGHDQMLLRYARDGGAWRPRVVVALLVDCDLPRNLTSFTVWHKPRYVLRDGALALTDRPPPTMASALSAYRGSPRLLDAARLFREAWRPEEVDARSHVDDRGAALAVALLDALGRRAHDDGARTVLLVAPIPGQLDEAWVSARNKTVDEVRDALCASGAWDRCVDAGPALLAAVRAGAPEHPPGASHWSAELHAALADVLTPALEATLGASAP